MIPSLKRPSKQFFLKKNSYLQKSFFLGVPKKGSYQGGVRNLLEFQRFSATPRRFFFFFAQNDPKTILNPFSHQKNVFSILWCFYKKSILGVKNTPKIGFFKNGPKMTPKWAFYKEKMLDFGCFLKYLKNVNACNFFLRNFFEMRFSFLKIYAFMSLRATMQDFGWSKNWHFFCKFFGTFFLFF